MDLSIKQTITLDYLEDKTTNEVIYGGGAGGGKSILGVYWVLKMCFKYPGTRWLIGRAKLKTLTETTLLSLFSVMQMQGINAGVYKYNQQKNIISFPNGSQIFLKDLFNYPSDPNFDELGSLEITGAFIDECNQIVRKAWDIVRSRIRYKLDDYGLIPKIMGSCNPSKNWVYTDFFLPNETGELPENKKFVQSLVTDNPFISKHYIENLKTLDPISRTRLLDGNWRYDNDPAKLIEYDKIINAFSNDYVQTGERFLSADIARFGSDKAVIMVWSGFRVEKILSYGKSSVTQLTETLKTLMREYAVPVSNVIADEDGVGGGVVDILGCKGFVNGGKPIDEGGEKPQYKNLKSQCYFHLARKINNGEIFIYASVDDRDQLIPELEQVKRYKIDSDDKLSVLPKDKVKELLGRSPDYADALMMRMYFELQPKQEYFFF